MIEKKCNNCREMKPIDAYGLDRSCTGGRRGTCLKCRAAKARLSTPRRVQAPKADPQEVANAWQAAALPVFSRGTLAWRVA